MKMAAIMKDSGKMIRLMEKDYLNMQMVIFTKAISKKTSEKEWQTCTILMDQSSMASGRMIKLMGKES